MPRPESTARTARAGATTAELLLGAAVVKAGAELAEGAAEPQPASTKAATPSTAEDLSMLAFPPRGRTQNKSPETQHS